MMRRRTPGTGPENGPCGPAARFPGSLLPLGGLHKGADNHRRASPGRSPAKAAVGVVLLTRSRVRRPGRGSGRPSAMQVRPGRRSPACNSRSSRGTSCGSSGPRRPAPGSQRSRPPGEGLRCRLPSRTRCRRAAGLLARARILARSGSPGRVCGPEWGPVCAIVEPPGRAKTKPAGGAALTRPPALGRGQERGPRRRSPRPPGSERQQVGRSGLAGTRAAPRRPRRRWRWRFRGRSRPDDRPAGHSGLKTAESAPGFRLGLSAAPLGHGNPPGPGQRRPLVDVASRGPLAALVVAVIAAGHLARVFAVDCRRGLVAAERRVSWPEHGSWRVVDHPVGCVVLSGVLCVCHRSNLRGVELRADRRARPAGFLDPADPGRPRQKMAENGR